MAGETLPITMAISPETNPISAKASASSPLLNNDAASKKNTKIVRERMAEEASNVKDLTPVMALMLNKRRDKTMPEALPRMSSNRAKASANV